MRTFHANLYTSLNALSKCTVYGRSVATLSIDFVPNENHRIYTNSAGAVGPGWGP